MKPIGRDIADRPEARKIYYDDSPTVIHQIGTVLGHCFGWAFNGAMFGIGFVAMIRWLT